MWLCWFLSHTDVTYNDRRILPLFIFFPDMSGVRVVGLYARNSFVETKSVFVTLNNDCCRRGGSGGDAIELKGKRYWLITHSLLRDVVVSRLIEPHCAMPSSPLLNQKTLWHQTNNDCWHYCDYAKAPMKWSMCPALYRRPRGDHFHSMTH